GSGHRAIPEVLPALSKAFACRRTVQRCTAVVCRRFGVREPADMAGWKAQFFEWHGSVAGALADRWQVGRALLRASVFLGNIRDWEDFLSERLNGMAFEDCKHENSFDCDRGAGGHRNRRALCG